MAEVVSEQLVIPYDSGPMREVRWFNAELVEKKRRFFRNQVISRLVGDLENCGWPTFTHINAGDIDKIKDPKLRYALRLADATEAVGRFEHSPGHGSTHFVDVEATQDGFDSTFIGAVYSGSTRDGTGSFMENLRRAAPDYDGNYGD